MTDTTKPQPSAPAEDLACVENAARVSLEIYGSEGRLLPFAIVETADRGIVVPSDGFDGEDSKLFFVNILRHVSIANGGERTALCSEAWTLFSPEPSDMDLMREIYARGGSLSEHPKAGEALIVMVESDAGSTMRMHRMVRDGDVVTLDPADTTFTPADARNGPSGILSGFHVPTGLQSHPAATIFSKGMAAAVPSHIVDIPKSGAAPQPN